MKKILIIILAALVSFQVQAQFTSAKLLASGLTCAMCSKAIYKALEKLPFAEKVQSNIKESSFTITFKKDSKVSFDEIRTAVEGAGFSVANLKVTGNFNDVVIKNDTHIVMDGENFHFVGVKPQVLNGAFTVQLVDKKFIADKVYNKYAAMTKMECINTGTMKSCCSKEASVEGVRIYHVTI